MNKRSRAAVIAIAASTLVVLSGCSDAGSGTAPKSSAPPRWDGKQIASAVVALPAPNQSLDPTASTSSTDRVQDALVNASLFALQADGSVKPGLASAYELTDGGKGATVHLRAAKFSDGSAITANDVVATFERELALKSNTLSAATSRIKTVKAVDPQTVAFTFQGAYPSFEGGVGLLSIFPASALKDAATYFKAPTVSAGAYTITKPWSSNKLELAANPYYWAGKPAVKSLTLEVVTDGNSAISQLQAGQVDFAGDVAPNFLGQVASAPKVHVEVTPQFGFYDLRLQNQHGPFKDVRVRRAVSAALDRTTIVKSIWGESNKPLAGLWPQSMTGYDSSIPVKQDLPAAKAALQGTACESGCTATMVYSDGDFAFSSQLALLVQSQLSQIGIKVKLEKLDAGAEVGKLFAGTFDIAPGAIASPGNTPDNLMGYALNGTGFLKAEFTGYNSDTMNALIGKTDEAAGDARTSLLGQVQQQFVTDQPFVTYAPWVRESATTLPAGVFQLVGERASVGVQH